jgi:hypothetical protein
MSGPCRKAAYGISMHVEKIAMRAVTATRKWRPKPARRPSGRVRLNHRSHGIAASIASDAYVPRADAHS